MNTCSILMLEVFEKCLSSNWDLWLWLHLSAQFETSVRGETSEKQEPWEENSPFALHLISLLSRRKKLLNNFMIFLPYTVSSGILSLPKCNPSRVTYVSDHAWAYLCVSACISSLDCQACDSVSVYILLCQLVLRGTSSCPVPD